MKTPTIWLLSLAGLSAGEVSEFAAEDFSEDNETSFFEKVFRGVTRLDSDFEILDHEDIRVRRTNHLLSQTNPGWDWEIGAYYTDYDIDYTDPVGATNAAQRSEENVGVNVGLGYEATDSVSFSFNGGYYDGFSDYQSVWIAEYYDQFVGATPGYEEADPQGWNLDFGVAWNYRPGGQARANLNYGEDEIVPAWSTEFPPPLFIPEAVPSEDLLESFGGSLTVEQALNAELKTQLSFRVNTVTGREERYQLQNNWAWALTDRLTMRVQIGGALEDPEFEAYYGGLSLNYEIASGWHLGVSGRLYHDTGDFTSGGFNTAAPELDSSEVSASLSWRNKTTTVRVSAGLFETDYGSLSVDNQFFADLYEDRDFFVGRFAVSHQF